jgi:hypothetical protein
MMKAIAVALPLGLLACSSSGVDHPPALVGPEISLSTPEETQLQIDATAVDPEDRALSYAATSPSHGKLSGSGPMYTYTPNALYFGTDALVITVSDGIDTVNVPVSITIERVDHAPVAVEQMVSTVMGVATPITLGASDVDSTVVFYTVTTAPANGTLTGTPPDLTYIPDPCFSGDDEIVYQVTDGELTSNDAHVAIHVDICGVDVVGNDFGCASAGRTFCVR